MEYLLISEETKEQPKPDKKQIDIGKEAAIEAEVRAARERAIVPLEIRIKSFKEMLAEKEVLELSLLIYSVVFPTGFSYCCMLMVSFFLRTFCKRV
jgi:transcription elongation regulator 1